MTLSGGYCIGELIRRWLLILTRLHVNPLFRRVLVEWEMCDVGGRRCILEAGYFADWIVAVWSMEDVVGGGGVDGVVSVVGRWIRDRHYVDKRVIASSPNSMGLYNCRHC